MRPSRLLHLLRLCVLIPAALWALAAAAHPDGPHGPAHGQRKSVVLVHGAFADGSCWSEVIRLLQAQGVSVVSVQNPLASLAGDVAATQRVIEQQTAPVVLVAHSWGGMVITEAGVHPKVAALVYVAAFAPDVGESVAQLLQPYPAPEWLGGIVQDSAGYQTLDEPTFLRHFAPDLPNRQARALSAAQGPTFGGTLVERTNFAAWRTKPTTYLLAEDDRIIPPLLQQAMAARASGTTTRLDAGHLLMLNRPARVAQAILAAVHAR